MHFITDAAISYGVSLLVNFFPSNPPFFSKERIRVGDAKLL